MGCTERGIMLTLQSNLPTSEWIDAGLLPFQFGFPECNRTSQWLNCTQVYVALTKEIKCKDQSISEMMQTKGEIFLKF